MKNKKEEFRELKRRWEEMVGMSHNPQERGRRFDFWLKDLFQASGLKAEGPFTRKAPNEELDGFIQEGLTIFLVEAKWEKAPINAHPVYIFHNKIQRSTIGTYGILISVSGFKENAIQTLQEMKPIRQFLIDRQHLEALLEQKIEGKVWLNTLVKVASLYAKPLISIDEIFNENKNKISSSRPLMKSVDINKNDISSASSSSDTDKKPIPPRHRFDFAISFAGPQREVARKLRDALAEKGFKIFYDRDFEHEMIGKDGSLYLRRIYSYESRYCIVLISKEYDKRDWPNLEREAIQSRELNHEWDILIPILTDDYKPEWLPSTRIYFDLKTRPFVELLNILQKKAGVIQERHSNKDSHFNIRNSKMETEALLQVIDEDEVIVMGMSDSDSLTSDNSLLVHKKLKKSLQAVLRIPARGRKGIKEGSETKLFTLHLKNNCSIGSGYYHWEIKGISIEGDPHIEFTRDPIKLLPNEASGAIADQLDKGQKIEFRLHPAKIKKIHTYNFSFKLRYSIGIQLYPTGEEDQVPAGGDKQIDFSITFQCFHDVKDNFLMIDFGSSTICAYYYSPYPKTPGENFRRIPLQSPMDHLPSEDDHLPTIINLRNVVRDGIKDAETVREVDDPNKMAVAGTEQFVDLPARDDIFNWCPETVLNSIELLIVKGMNIVPIPKKVNFGILGEKRPFTFIDENGMVKQGFPTLKSVLKSCFHYLIKNYIDKTQWEYRRLVLIYPNVYKNSHISFLQNEVLKEVFQETGRIYFENIQMENESNCLLYYYLSKRSLKNIPNMENVMVIDLSDFAMCISYAVVEWERWAVAAATPGKIEVIKRDGTFLGDETLDKAIALQVHNLLKQFSQFEDVDYANKIATSSELDLTPEGKSILKKVMFAFKIRHILNFKKGMAESDDDDPVDICLGENDKQNGLCELRQGSHEISLAQDQGEPIPVTLKNKFGKLYIGMKKRDWLNLPYLRRFEQLLIEKLIAFKEDIDIPGNFTIVLSGRTSLWPAISRAVKTVFAGINIDWPEDIWPSDIAKKALELKRAVILGAVLKATTWKAVEFKEVVVSGVEAVRYQKGVDSSKPGSWSIEPFPRSSELSLTINLDNSSYFELGIKTSMDFVPFMGADTYKRDDYCHKSKEITITLEKLPESGYQFYVKSDKYQRGKGTRLTHILSHETAFLRTRTRYWPVKDAQLREIEPEEFNENV